MSQQVLLPTANMPTGTRRASDAYYTPDDLAEVLVGLLPIEQEDGVLEPHCGGGSFVRALLRRTCSVSALDIDPTASGLRAPSVSVYDCDFLAWGHDPLNLPLWIVGNPPFGDAELHVRHALGLTRRHVAFLLRLAFLESSERVAFWAEHPCRLVWVLSQRPSFTGGQTDSCAYGFFWWDSAHTGATSLEVVSWR